MRIFLIALLSLVLLTGCSLTDELVVKTKPVDRIPLVLPDVDRYSHRQIEWRVVTVDNVEEVFKELQNSGQPLAVIGLAGDDYELLALNTSDQQVLIKQLLAIIKAYKTYYIAVEKRDDTSNVIVE